MNLSFACVVVVSALAHVASVVQAELMINVHFNNGIADPTKSCAAANDDAWLDKVFAGPLIRRNLRASNDVEEAVEVPTNFIELLEFGGRKLSYRAECAKLCENIINCRRTGCEGYNGRIRNRELQNYAEGYLSNSAVCNSTAATINSDLNYLVSQNKVSTSCKNLLKAPRKIECYEEVMYGIVEKFIVVNAETDTVTIPFLHARQTICGAQQTTFQVEVSPCVKFVNLTLVNKNAGYRSTKILNTTIPGPYTQFGVSSTNVKNFFGQRLPFGNYTIEATPDGVAGKMRDRMFYLENCTGVYV